MIDVSHHLLHNLSLELIYKISIFCVERALLKIKKLTESDLSVCRYHQHSRQSSDWVVGGHEED